MSYSIIKGEFCAPPDGLDFPVANAEKIPWGNYRYLTAVLEGRTDHTLTFQLDFYTAGSENPAMRIAFSILPRMICTVPIDLTLLNAQTLFPERTKGRLRMIIYGKPLLRGEITQLHLSTLKCVKEQNFVLHDLYLTDEAPAPVLPDVPLMDEMGQWIPKRWKGKLENTQKLAEMLRNKLSAARKAEKAGFTYEQEDWDSCGGWTKKRFSATGWFRVEKEDGRFWLVDPEGCAFYSTGIDCIGPGNDTRIDLEEELCSWFPDRGDPLYEEAWSRDGRCFNYGIANLIRAFGKEAWKESFYRIVRHDLYRWHVNTIGNWSDPDFIRHAKMPYVLPLDALGKEFPSTRACVFRDFPDVFAPEYEENAAAYAKAILPFREDRFLIGYFMRNEPNWAFVKDLNIAEEMLASDGELYSKREFVRFLEEKYAAVEELNRAWNLTLQSFSELLRPIRRAAQLSARAKEDLTAFSIKMITRYCEIPAKAVRKLDPHHLNLGMRYAFVTDPVVLSGHEYFDVFSINLYQMTPYEEIQAMGELLKMPLMIGEFHFGALDAGLVSTGLRAVENEEQRGRAYRYYAEQGARSPYFIGAHYFQFADQNCLGRFDGENYQIGITDVALQEYEEMTAAMTECHRHIYEVASGERPACEEKAWELPAVHC